MQLVGDGDALARAGADDLGDFRHRVFGLFPADQVEIAGVGLEDRQLEAGDDHHRAPLPRDQQQGQPFAGPFGEAEQVEQIGRMGDEEPITIGRREGGLGALRAGSVFVHQQSTI